MHKLVVFGSARIDAFLGLPEHKVDTFCDLDTRKCVIQLSYASKIPMKSVDFRLGGNGANVAVGTKRMGVSSVLVAEVGSGVMGDYARKELEAQGADMSFVTQTPGVPAGFGAVISYQRERTILSYYPPGEPPFPREFNSCTAEWVYLTSVGESFEKYYEKILEWLNHCNPKVAFNPGARQIEKGQEWLKPYLEKTEILLANREECQEIAKFSDSFGKEKELIQALVALGPKRVVVTDGRNGSYGFDGEKYYRLGILPVEVVSRTGAGDATSTGVLAAIIKGKTMGEVMLWGMLNSTSVIGHIGPQPGLLYERDIPIWLKRAEESNIKVEEM